MSTVQLEVSAVDIGSPIAGISAVVELGGQERTIALHDDGSVAADTARDGVWVGSLEGERTRLLPVRIRVTTNAATAPSEVWAAIEPVESDGAELVYELSEVGGPLRANRVAAPWLGQPRPTDGREVYAVLGAWTVLAFLVVGYHAMNAGRA